MLTTVHTYRYINNAWATTEVTWIVKLDITVQKLFIKTCKTIPYAMQLSKLKEMLCLFVLLCQLVNISLWIYIAKHMYQLLNLKKIQTSAQTGAWKNMITLTSLLYMGKINEASLYSPQVKWTGSLYSLHWWNKQRLSIFSIVEISTGWLYSPWVK